MLEQTRKLYEIFNEEQKNKINLIIREIENRGSNYKTNKLWEFDQTLGGIGGYCQGCDPARENYFQGTEFRNVYRCLQYVRSDIDILDINYTARYIIQNCGHHFEAAIKLYLKRTNKVRLIKVHKYPLGKLLQYVADKKILQEEVIVKLKLFIDLYNISKHEILSDDELDRTFHADDAIICYFACRIVGKEILLLIDNEREKETYETNWNKYSFDINRF